MFVSFSPTVTPLNCVIKYEWINLDFLACSRSMPFNETTIHSVKWTPLALTVSVSFSSPLLFPSLSWYTHSRSVSLFYLHESANHLRSVTDKMTTLSPSLLLPVTFHTHPGSGGERDQINRHNLQASLASSGGEWVQSISIEKTGMMCLSLRRTSCKHWMFNLRWEEHNIFSLSLARWKLFPLTAPKHLVNKCAAVKVNN